MVRLSFATACLVAIATSLCATTLAEATEASNAAVFGQTTQGDDVKQLLSVVLAETEDFWGAVFKADGLKYEEPKLVLYTGIIATACGPVSGTSYCGRDHRIYLDPAFPEFRKIGLTGDFGKALVLAREVGHHVQNISEAPRPPATADSEDTATLRSQRVELQADCFAGLWTRYVQDQHLLDDADLTEARDLLRSLGDDQAANVSKDPKAKSYGTSDQRIRWYDRGLAGKAIADCKISNNPL